MVLVEACRAPAFIHVSDMLAFTPTGSGLTVHAWCRMYHQMVCKNIIGLHEYLYSSTCVSTVARQTKTIAFSLSEPNAAQENWILDTPNEEDQLQSALPGSVVKRKEDVGSFKTGNRQRRRRRRGKTSDEEDEDDMVTWLKQWYVEVSM